MDIAQAAMGMKHMQLQQQVGIKVHKMALDTVEQQAAAMQKLLQSAQTIQDSALGQNIDILA
jgi:hypothetical protein